MDLQLDPIDLPGAYEDAMKDLADAQMRLRFLASALAKVQTEVAAKAAVAQFIGRELDKVAA